MKKIFISIIITIISLFLIIGGAFIFLKENNYLVTPQTEEETLKAEIVGVEPAKETTEFSNEKKVVMPRKFKLEVPFTSQAPGMSAPWPEDFDEACEEAAILIVDAYIKGKKLTPEVVKNEILKMLNFQENNYGERNKDLEAEEVAKLVKDFYGYSNIRVGYDNEISIEAIKKEIFAGNPVILPAAGRKLNNPYYSGEGPLYHMLVAVGWDETEDEIITNDPGTKRGEGFSYKYDVLLNALHEWNGGAVDNGRSAMIIIQK
ncbi:MAG: C39 family peptidase [Candidatus Bathyarchaeota archaeon]|nr:C39 family peptidase [Candidatus Bathyarchaeota archaeon]